MKTHANKLKQNAVTMTEKLTSDEKRPWHLEMAISLTIAGLGTMVWLASASVI